MPEATTGIPANTRTGTPAGNRIAVVSDREVVSIFLAAGIDCYILKKNLQQSFEEIYKRDYKIIFVTENVYLKCAGLLRKEKTFPVVTVIPDTVERENIGIKALLKYSVIATGTELIK
ncbi:MAG: V-type ATP synthase subunit F [Elusimicrobiota bacterium]